MKHNVAPGVDVGTIVFTFANPKKYFARENSADALLPLTRRPFAPNFDRKRFTFGRLGFQTTSPLTHAAAGGVHLEERSSPPAAGASSP